MKLNTHNRTPKEKNGKMIKVSGVSFDPNNPVALPTHWEGWLPQKGLKILKQL